MSFRLKFDEYIRYVPIFAENCQLCVRREYTYDEESRYRNSKFFESDKHIEYCPRCLDCIAHIGEIKKCLSCGWCNAKSFN